MKQWDASPGRGWHHSYLLVDLGHDAGADGTTAFADREAQAFVHGDREAQRDVDLHVVARHHHLDAFRQLDRTGHVRRAEVELRTIVAEERRVTATLVLRQDVHLTLELGVRRDRTRLGQNLAALDVFTLQTADQHADVVTGLTLVEQLAEHFHARDRRGLGVLQTDHFGRVTHLDDTALHATGQHRATTRDREHVFHRQQERLVDVTLRLRNPAVQRVDQLDDRRHADLGLVAIEGQTGRTVHDRRVVARELVLRQQL